MTPRPVPLARVPCLACVAALGSSLRRRPSPRTDPTRSSSAGRSGRTRTCASAGGPARSRPRRSRRPSRPPRRTRRRVAASKAPTFTYDAGGAQPDRLRRRGDVRRERPRLLHPGRPERLHDVAPRAGPRLRLGHAQVVPGYTTAPNGCYDAETIALDEFGHVDGLGHHVNRADDSDYLDAVVQTFSRTKPNAGWNVHSLGRCDTATLQLRYDMLDAAAKYSTCLDLATVLTVRASPPRSSSVARRR